MGTEQPAPASGLRRYLPTIAGLLLVFGLPFLFNLYLGSARESLSEPSTVLQTIGREWGITILLLLVILFWERQPLSSIGLWKMDWKDALLGVGGFILGSFVFVATIPLLERLNLGTTGAGIAELAQVPLGLRVAVVLTAGITEEILFRGYPIERLNMLTGNLPLSAGLAYLAFVLLHIPFWGPGGTIQIGLWSIVITALYVWRRSLPACMLMHILNDAYAFILLPMLFLEYLPAT